jgi:hypothetical protein
MGHKKADERETVIKWLEECDKNPIKPWEWDFKNCYTDSLPKDSITALLEYKNGEFKDNTSDFNITKNTGFNADCDKEAIGLYQVLGWQNSATDVIRGETMNSFLTNFYCAIGYRPKDKKPRPSRDYLSKNYAKFDVISKNIDGFKLFATRTHTIGNFIVLPHWMNTGRIGFSADYWDITLLSLQEWLHLISPTSEAWVNFIELYYLQPYVNKDYQTELFWEKHSYGYDNLFPSKQDVPIFLKAVNERIEERGKYMIKQICDRLNRTDFNFYKEIRDMDKIRFSDEF